VRPERARRTSVEMATKVIRSTDLERRRRAVSCGPRSPLSRICWMGFKMWHWRYLDSKREQSRARGIDRR
jgi:hypothetical protein